MNKVDSHDVAVGLNFAKHKTKMKILELLGFNRNEHSIKVEVLAGVTTFLTMCYILAVNPLILGDAGMDRGAVFSATTVQYYWQQCCSTSKGSIFRKQRQSSKK